MVLQTIRKALVTLAAVGFSPAQAPETPIKVDVEVVNVFCTVHDHHGALVRDLKLDDFKLLEDNRPQEIRYFAQESNLPLTVAPLKTRSAGRSPIVAPFRARRRAFAKNCSRAIVSFLRRR
jgi:hypothetical protein